MNVVKYGNVIIGKQLISRVTKALNAMELNKAYTLNHVLDLLPVDERPTSSNFGLCLNYLERLKSLPSDLIINRNVRPMQLVRSSALNQAEAVKSVNVDALGTGQAVSEDLVKAETVETISST